MRARPAIWTALCKSWRNDAILYSDGGGKALAALAPIRGADKIARFFVGIPKKVAAGPGGAAAFASMASPA